MRRHVTQRGFTIIRDHARRVIIGVLAALIVPNIRLNTVRVKMSEVILAFAPSKRRQRDLPGRGDPPADASGGARSPTRPSTSAP